MNPIFFVTNIRPISYNNTKNKKIYQEKLTKDFNEFAGLYSNIPLTLPLYSKVIYIHKNQHTLLDVDNLSKPFIDAFPNVIYSDDNLINHRICSKITKETFSLLEFEMSNYPDKIAEKLDEYLSNGSEHILYFEVGEFKNEMVKFGGE